MIHIDPNSLIRLATYFNEKSNLLHEMTVENLQNMDKQKMIEMIIDNFLDDIFMWKEFSNKTKITDELTREKIKMIILAKIKD